MAQFWSHCERLARKAHWDQRRDLDGLQSYWTGTQSEFQTFKDDLAEAEGSNRTDKIQSHAQQQLSAARKEEHKQLRSEEYKLWLCEAQQKGMKPLLKAIRSHENLENQMSRKNIDIGQNIDDVIYFKKRLTMSMFFEIL